ncbi:proteasome subunit beta type-6-like [Sycon ciliatum]|uniref:proteasome subunit beta type-6-like n=1 Tax=Sycon ciliatum TaxID=27933 RepID=UPI0020A93EFB|eukprot:scpid90276/ scgid6697/ Proteasome subunit beta type-6; Low molecular mass protein 19; Macropain delta chain; Multicatalytic endopeptidase complex delta chain; Proteasome delta chain; Proteasome subunit Y
MEASPEWMSKAHALGTSIMAVQFDGGVVLGADSRTSTGSYVANRVTDKIAEVSSHIFCCRSGSAADTQAITGVVKYELEMLELELEDKSKVSQAAHMFRKYCFEYRESLSAGIIIGGWDKANGGQVYCIPLGGMLVKQPFAIGGSGSTYIYGYCDSAYKDGMTRDECEQFVVNALSLAMSRDGSSGGVIRLVTIDESGVARRTLTGKEIPTFYEG